MRARATRPLRGLIIKRMVQKNSIGGAYTEAVTSLETSRETANSTSALISAQKAHVIANKTTRQIRLV